MSARAVGAIRSWDARLTAEHGPDAVWAAVSHGDPIKAILADALGMHLDSFQRILVDPARSRSIRYTPTRPVRDHRSTPPRSTWVRCSRRRRKKRAADARRSTPRAGAASALPRRRAER